MGRYVVASVDEIPPGGRRVVELAGRSIGVFNIAGEYFALRNRCPHQGGPLCLGSLSGLVSSSDPGDYTVSRQGEILRCPWHGWEFDIRTGQSWCDPKRVRVRRYDVVIEPHESSAGVAVEPSIDREQGPYIAETYPVTVERRDVVIDVPD